MAGWLTLPSSDPEIQGSKFPRRQNSALSLSRYNLNYVEWDVKHHIVSFLNGYRIYPKFYQVYSVLFSSWSLYHLRTFCGDSDEPAHLPGYYRDLYSLIYEPAHNKTNKMACAPSEDSDQPGHPPSLIRVYAVHVT